MEPGLYNLLEIVGVTLLAVLSFLGIRIFRHIDALTDTIKMFQRDMDQRIDSFRRDFDVKCDNVHNRITQQGERLARLEQKVDDQTV